MTDDVTAGRAAGTPLNAELDPMGRAEAERRRRPEEPSVQEAEADTARDPITGRSPGSTTSGPPEPPRAADRQPRR